MIDAGGSRDFEFITRTTATRATRAADKLGGIPADSPLDYYVRIVSDGENLTAAYSYDGTTFPPVGRPVSLATFTDAKIGPAALSASARDRAGGALRLDPVRPGRLGRRRLRGHRRRVRGHDLGAAWAAGPRRPGRGRRRRHPADPGPARATSTRPATTPRTWSCARADGAWQAVTKLNFEGTAQYHQAGIMVYGNDDNFTKFGRIAHSAAGDEKFEFINEVNAVARNEAADSTANIPAAFPDDFWLRLTSDGTNVVGSLLDRRDHVDRGRASGGAPGERQDRSVRVLQRRRGQPDRGLRLLHPHR